MGKRVVFVEEGFDRRGFLLLSVYKEDGIREDYAGKLLLAK